MCVCAGTCVVPPPRMCKCGCACVEAHMWKTEDNFRESVPFLRLILRQGLFCCFCFCYAADSRLASLQASRWFFCLVSHLTEGGMGLQMWTLNLTFSVVSKDWMQVVKAVGEMYPLSPLYFYTKDFLRSPNTYSITVGYLWAGALIPLIALVETEHNLK